MPCHESTHRKYSMFPLQYEPILSPAIITIPIQWSLDDQIHKALQTVPGPPGDPEGRSYIPTTLRIPLMDSPSWTVHSSPGSGHPRAGLRLPCHKLSPCYISPFIIQHQINKVTYCLSLPAQYRISPTFHVSLLKPYTNPLVSPSTGSSVAGVPPPPPVESEKGSIYKVNTILD